MGAVATLSHAQRFPGLIVVHALYAPMLAAWPPDGMTVYSAAASLRSAFDLAGRVRSTIDEVCENEFRVRAPVLWEHGNDYLIAPVTEVRSRLTPLLAGLSTAVLHEGADTAFLPALGACSSRTGSSSSWNGCFRVPSHNRRRRDDEQRIWRAHGEQQPAARSLRRRRTSGAALRIWQLLPRAQRPPAHPLVDSSGVPFRELDRLRAELADLGIAIWLNPVSRYMQPEATHMLVCDKSVARVA